MGSFALSFYGDYHLSHWYSYPVPGFDPDRLAELFNQNQGTFLGLFNMFSGGALERMSILALGVMPYISASIIMQLLAATVPDRKSVV